ncbi:MAG TPA: hypothetical protein VGG39_01665 [Polyangiaceae bacterium]
MRSGLRLLFFLAMELLAGCGPSTSPSGDGGASNGNAYGEPEPTPVCDVAEPDGGGAGDLLSAAPTGPCDPFSVTTATGGPITTCYVLVAHCGGRYQDACTCPGGGGVSEWSCDEIPACPADAGND